MNQPKLNWEECHAAFHVDGSLRDIYVYNTVRSDWEKLLGYLSQYSISWFRDGEPCDFPDQISEVFAERSEHSIVAKTSVNGIIFICHFFTLQEIEIDLDPVEISNQHELDVVVSTLAGIGSTLGKRVVLTEESSPEDVWFDYDPEAGVLGFCKLLTIIHSTQLMPIYSFERFPWQ